MPKIIIVAGPNGAGKTTFTREFLAAEPACDLFVNADLIAQGMSPTDPQSVEVAAGRTMLARLDELTDDGEDFTIETTLSGGWLRNRIVEWRAKGYFVELPFLRLASAEMAIQRVQKRVRQGGHAIPEPVIRRRFQRGLQHLNETYKPCVDRWMVYDNSGLVPILLESGENS